MQEIIVQLIDFLGGKENIVSLSHCVTRLRFVLSDDSRVNVSEIEKLEGVKGVFYQNNQCQVVIGPMVKDYYEAVMEQIETPEGKQAEKISVQQAAEIVSEIFAPLIPLIILGGFSCGLENILAGLPVQASWFQWLVQMFRLVNTCAFTFVPTAIIWSIVKKCHGSEILAIALGISMILGAYVPELNQMAHYEGQVVPAVFAALLLVGFEKLLAKYTKPSIRMIVVPFGTLILSILAMQTIVGPIASDMNHGIAYMLSWCFQSNVRYFIAPLIGFGYAYIVKSGWHHFTVPLDLILVSEYHFTYLWPLLALSNIAQGAACYFYSMTLTEKNREEAKQASISCFLGVSEPAMFSYNMPAKEPFTYAVAASTASCFIAGLFKVRAYSIGIGGLPGILTIMLGWDFLAYLLCIAAAVGIPYYIMTNPQERKALYLKLKQRFKKEKTETVSNDVPLLENEQEESSEEVLDTEAEPTEKVQTISLKMPFDGKIFSLDDVGDEVFSSRSMGEGIAVEMTDGHVICMADGKLTTCFPDGHAYGLTLDNGLEVLLHIGIDTVQAGSECFNVHVTQGDMVVGGQSLVDVDIQQLKEKGCSLMSPLIFIEKKHVTCPQIGQTLKAGEILNFEMKEDEEK